MIELLTGEQIKDYLNQYTNTGIGTIGAIEVTNFRSEPVSRSKGYDGTISFNVIAKYWFKKQVSNAGFGLLPFLGIKFMTNKECCCTCYFGDPLDIDETICMYRIPNVCIMTLSYYWVCLHWKELNLWGYPNQPSNGFGLDYF